MMFPRWFHPPRRIEGVVDSGRIGGEVEERNVDDGETR